MKNILHISDLHLSTIKEHGFFYEKANKLIEMIELDLKENHSEAIDTIFLTGDIAFSGIAEEFEMVRKYFIVPLLDSLSLDFDALFFVPGNHDIDRKNISLTEKHFRDTATKEVIKELSEEVNTKKTKWKRLDSFNTFKLSLLEECNNVLYDAELITVRNANTNIIIHCLNSAWLAGDDYDQGKLRILNQLKYSLEKYGRGKSNIVLIHHPTDWFHLDEQSSVAQEIEKRVDILFFGHMHQFEQSVTINFSQDITLRLQAGTLDTRNQSSGYSIIQLHTNNKIEFGTVKYRKYSSEEEKYLPWLEMGNNGKHDYSIDKALLFDSDKFSEISLILREKLEFDHIINTGLNKDEKKRLSDIYIDPKFIEQNELSKDLDDIKGISSLSELLDAKGVVVISGMEQDGKSSLLKHIQSIYLNKQINKDLSQIVFYLDLKGVQLNNVAKVLLDLISSYLDHDLQTSFEGKVKAAIQNGNAKILFDNIDKAAKETKKSVYDFIKKYKENSFLLTSDNSTQAAVLSELQHLNSNLYRASIGNIARNDIRKIISLRPQLSTIRSEDEIFNNVINLINNSQLPHNHFVYSILLVIYESENDLHGILNESDIIENYIEILLRKHCMDIPANKPQYKVLIQFLGYLATSMLNSKSSQLTEKEMYSVIIEYERCTFHEFKIDDYTAPAIKSGILQKNNCEQIEFSNNCFFYYFISCYMDTDVELHTKVFSGDNYLHLDKVVEYYSSKNSSSFNILDFLSEKLLVQKKLLSDMIFEEQLIDINSLDLNELDNISILDLASTNKEKFEEKITGLSIDRDDYDEKLDGISPLRNERNNKTSVKNIDNNTIGGNDIFDISMRYKKELNLLSKVFRNAELLMDSDKVIALFDVIIKSYVFIMKVDISRLDENMVLPLISKKINEEYFSENTTSIEKAEFINGFKMVLSICRSAMPNQIETIMSEAMASKKPRFKKILEIKLRSTEDEIEELLLRFMLLEVDRKNLKMHIEALLQKKGKLTMNALFFKSAQLIYTKHDLNKNDGVFLRKTASALVQKNDIPIHVFQKLIK